MDVLYVGVYKSTTSELNGLVGLIDEIRIYNRTLSTEEIDTLSADK